MSEESIRMDCAQFEEILPDLNRPGTRGMALRESALAHAESCRGCARLLAEAQSLDRALGALAAQEKGLQAPARVEANLVQEFRRQRAAVSRPRVRWVAAIGIAAAILLALGISLRHRPGVSPGGGSVAETPAAGPVLPPKSEAAERSAPAGKPGQSSQSAPSGEQDDFEDAAGFVLLPYAADPAAADDGAIVRVMMSRAALASLGFSVKETGSEERVRADLVVSEDGTPQAIRLVSAENTSRDF